MEDFSKLVNPEFASAVGVRASQSNPQVAEFYNPQSKMAFENPQMLSNYVQSTFQRNDVNANNIFDVLKTPTTPQAPATPTISPAVAQQNRINELQANVFSQPVNTQSIYDEEYKKAGLGGIQSRLSQIDKDITDIKAKYSAKMGNISENPWLSEASRVGRSRVLNDQMQSEIGNYLEQRNRIADLYNMGLNEVNLRLGLRTNDANSTRDTQAKELNYLLDTKTNAQNTQNKAIEFGYNNNVKSPFFSVGGTIYRSSDMKAYSTPEEFFADGGAKDFSNVQNIQKTPDEKLLTPTEAKALGVPYGTTQSQAAQMGITPTTATAKKTTSPGSPSKKVSTADATNEILDIWSQGYIQGNGKISSSDFKKAREWWISQGLSNSSFNSQFQYLVDKSGDNWKSEYGF